MKASKPIQTHPFWMQIFEFCESLKATDVDIVKTQLGIAGGFKLEELGLSPGGVTRATGYLHDSVCLSI